MSYEMMDCGARVHVGGKRSRQTKQETREQVIARNSFPGDFLCLSGYKKTAQLNARFLLSVGLNRSVQHDN